MQFNPIHDLAIVAREVYNNLRASPILAIFGDHILLLAVNVEGVCFFLVMEYRLVTEHSIK